jgi:hypothetical protein
MQSARGRLWRELLISTVVVAAALLIFFHRQTILDQILLWRYTPGSDIERISDELELTPVGERYFYVSRPQLLTKDDFNRYCQSRSERSIILGCYVSQRIYVYQVNDERLPYVEEVTAAHEMLHAAYERLGKGERERIDKLLQQTVNDLTDERLLNLVDLYQESEPGELLNEMHAILGTEAQTLPAELEEYYQRYFSNRAEIVEMARSYDKVFVDLRAKQQSLVSRVKALADQITQRNNEFNTRVEAFQADVSAFNAKAQGGGFTSDQEYNQQRAILEGRQADLNAERDKINDMIADLKKMQDELRSLAFEAASLNQSLDSHAPEAVPQFN